MGVMIHKIPAEKLKAFLHEVSKGSFKTHAALSVGITRAQLKSYERKAHRDRDSGLTADESEYVAWLDELDVIEAQVKNEMLAGIKQAAIDDWKAAKWYLEIRDREFFYLGRDNYSDPEKWEASKDKQQAIIVEFKKYESEKKETA